MNRDVIKKNASFTATVLVVVGAVWALWKDATDPNAVDHLTRQPDGTYK